MPSDDSTRTESLAALAALALPVEEALHSATVEVLKAAVSDPALDEDLALALLKRRDLPPEVLEQLGKNSSVMESRKLKLAVSQHPRTPRHVSLPLGRQLFTFDLMQLALAPLAPAGIKKAAEDALLNRLESVSVGEKISLARLASARVATALLLDPDPSVMRAALENPGLTEACVVKALARRDAPAAFVHAVCGHAKWSLRQIVRIALLRNENTPSARALELARALPATLLKDVLERSTLSGNLRLHRSKEDSGKETEPPR
jgi:hypothetical protein